MDSFFRTLKITAFDLFAYLVPGGVFLLVATLLFRASHDFRGTNLEVFLGRALAPGRLETWVLILLSAYISGVIAQGIPEAFEQFRLRVLGVSWPYGSPSEFLLARSKELASVTLGTEFPEDEFELLYHVSSQAISQRGRLDSLEMLQHRVGLYGGLLGSTVLSAAVLLVCWVWGGLIWQPVPWIPVVVALALIFGLLVFRYYLSAWYRVRYVTLAFLITPLSPAPGDPSHGPRLDT